MIGIIGFLSLVPDGKNFPQCLSQCKIIILYGIDCATNETENENISTIIIHQLLLLYVVTMWVEREQEKTAMLKDVKLYFQNILCMYLSLRKIPVYSKYPVFLIPRYYQIGALQIFWLSVRTCQSFMFHDIK